MKIGYPCLNLSVNCSSSNTFRLKNYSEENLIKTIEQNISCFKKILEFNVKNNILFFRITSDLIPFASHDVCKYNWQKHFKKEFECIGEYIKKFNMRISMHPDQFVVLNSPNEQVVFSSIKELIYHEQVLSLLNLDTTAKIQIHVGGVYNDKNKSILRFVEVYKKLPQNVKERLVIENDDKSYTLSDCLKIYELTGVPVLFDYFHHQVNSSNENINEAMKKCCKTWEKKDGIPMVDYSSQKKNVKKGSHNEHIDIKDFKNFIQKTKDFDFDIMLEIKDKEKSALEALKILKRDSRLVYVKNPYGKKC